MSISKSDLGRSISDLEGKNSKFRRLNLLRGVPKNISVRFYRFPIKTVGGVRKSAKKWPKMASLSPVPVEPLFGRPRDLCPDISFFYVHIHERFRSNRISEKWSKNSEISQVIWFNFHANANLSWEIIFFKTNGDPFISARTLERSQFLDKYPGQIQRHFVAMKNDENEREIAEEKILVEPEEESIVRVITGNIVRTLLEDSNMQQDRI